MRARIAGALIIAAIFLALAGDGLAAYFTPDDMMNLYAAWFRPLLAQERPLGALVYRALFAAFGLNPLPYRVVCFLLLAGNLALLYAVAARLSGSRRVAALACLAGAYHAHLADLYYSTGTIYDLLCFAFYWCAALLWMRGREWAALGLYAAALLSKEMAVTLPAVLLVYELVAGGGRMRILRLAPMAAVTGLFVWRVLTASGANAAYTPHFTWHIMAENWANYTFDLFYGAVRMSAGRVLLLWTLVAAVVALVRTRDAVVAAAVVWIGLLPVAFIAQRGFYVMYLTLPGWYLLGARLIERITQRANAAVVFAVAAAVLIPLHAARKEKGRWWVADAHATVRAVLEPLGRQRLPRGARVLMASDPYEKDDFILTFMFRLRFRDDAIVVDRAKLRAAEGEYARVYRVTGDSPQNWRLQEGE